MDPTAFIALGERCAPSAEPRLLAGLVQRASGSWRKLLIRLKISLSKSIRAGSGEATPAMNDPMLPLPGLITRVRQVGRGQIRRRAVVVQRRSAGAARS